MAEVTFETVINEARALIKDNSNLDSAAEKFTKAKELAAEDNNSMLIAETGLAEVAVQRKDWTAATESFANAAAAIAKGADDVKAIIRMRYINGICLLCQNKEDEALKEFEVAKEKAAEPLSAEIEKRISSIKSDVDVDELIKAAIEFDTADVSASRKRKASDVNQATEETNGDQPEAEKKAREETVENGNKEAEAEVEKEAPAAEVEKEAPAAEAEKPAVDDEGQVHPDADMPLKDGEAAEEPAIKAKSVEDVQAGGDRVTSTA